DQLQQTEKQTKVEQQEKKYEQKAEPNNNQKIKERNRTSNFISHLVQQKSQTYKEIREKYQKDRHQHILLHQSLIDIGLKFNNNLIMGSNKRCIYLMEALKKLICDFRTNEPDFSFVKELSISIDKIINFIQNFRAISEGMNTAFQYIKQLIGYLYNSQVSIETQQQWLCQQINYFIKQKIYNAQELIIQIGLQFINNGDYILIYAHSQVVESLLIQAHKKGKQFTVIVVDNPPFNEGKQLFNNLTKQGIQCIYTLLSNVPYFIKKTSKIFVGASSMLKNGSLVSRVGTALLSCVSKEHRIPFHVFCESYKFSEKSQLDSLSQNELNVQRQTTNINIIEINLRYDLTPCQNINMVVTEIGPVPPTSVHTIIREFTSNDYVGKIELPKE
ncbi:hypothetical protein IMG5_106300, partial [Ichthyophthirius multifiliis]